MESVSNIFEQNKTIWVGDIELWMDEAYLSRTFGAVGRVVNVKLVRDWALGGRHKGYGFVQFASRTDAERAFENLNQGEPFITADGRHLKINWAARGLGIANGMSGVSTSVYVGNLEYNVHESQLLMLFSKKYSSVSGAKVITDPSGVCKGFGFVQFQDPADAESALSEMQGVYCGSKPIRVRPAVKHCQGEGGNANQNMQMANMDKNTWVPKPPPPTTLESHSVLISGLDPSIAETQLYQYFAAFGMVHQVQLLGDQGCGVVMFRDRVSAEGMVQSLNGYSNGYSTVLAQHVDGVECGAAAAGQFPVITNATTANAQSMLLSQLQAQGQATPNFACTSPATGLEHFHMLLRHPDFVKAFEAQLLENDGNPTATEEHMLPWLLQDRHELFNGVLSIQKMNQDFIPAFGSPRCSAYSVPSLPQALRIFM